ncbi:MAG TPA: hypothetical protein VKG92_07670, partial [Flavobacteriales bacterium]|nr:hypothetical protein [Flavobacteriales bacterium]
MLRKILIAVYYGVLVHYLVVVGPSVFIMLMSLWCEMVLMLLLFVVFSLRMWNEEQIGKMCTVFIASIVLLGFMYAMAMWLGQLLHEFEGTSMSVAAPVAVFRPAVVPMVLSLVLIYTLNAVDFVVKKQDMEVIESGLRFQVMLLMILGLAGLLF